MRRAAHREGGADAPAVTSEERRAGAVAVATALFVALAVVLEVIAGARANSANPPWAEVVVPLAWPRPARVVWWLAVAAAMAAFHRSLHRLGLGRSRSLAIASVAPFLIFAAGVASGQSWASFH
ncbi:MAG TPA: hypothetical protein VK988_22480 [Acidimicrobiales bacterium]|nr:hypothetical protein [Acidimicrobiales bacterium]